MLDSPPKRMAVLAAVSFVLIASLLMFNASDNDGEGSEDTTEGWSAAMFTSGQSTGTYYNTIQEAVNAAQEIMKSGIQLHGDYHSLFVSTNLENIDEAIWYREYLTSESLNVWHDLTLQYNTSTASQKVSPTKPLMNMYLKADGTPIETGEVSLNDEFKDRDPRLAATIRNAGGLEAYRSSNENTWEILDRLAPTGTLPRLMFACGTEDDLLYDQFCIFRAHAEEIGLKAHWFELEGYRHEWRFWDLAIQEALSFFKLDE